MIEKDIPPGQPADGDDFAQARALARKPEPREPRRRPTRVRKWLIVAALFLTPIAAGIAATPAFRVNALQYATQSSVPGNASATNPIVWFDNAATAPRMHIDNGTGSQIVGSGSVDITAYGGHCDGVTSDTTAFTNAVAATPPNGTMVISCNTYLATSANISKPMTLVVEAGVTLTIGPTTIGITSDNVAIVGRGWSSKIVQGTVNNNLFSATSFTGFQLRNLAVVGVAGTSIVSSNSVAIFTTMTDVTVDGVLVTNFQHYAFWSKGGSRITIQNSTFVGNMAWLAAGGTGLTFFNNTVRDPQTPNTTFCIPMQFDSTSGGFGVATDLHVNFNRFYNWTASQNILFHSGDGFEAIGNLIENGYIGIAVGVFQAGDTIQDGVLANNIIRLTTVSGLSTGIADTGINLGGIAGQQVSRVKVIGNTVTKGNNYSLNDFWGCILVAGNVVDSTFDDNTLEQCYGNGISMSGDSNLRIDMHDNHMHNFQDSAGSVKTGIGIWNNTNQSGWARHNDIDGVRVGIRCDVNTSGGFVVGENKMTNVASIRVFSPGNCGATSFTDGYRLDGIGTSQSSGVGESYQNLTAAANGAQQASPLTEWLGQGWDSTNTLSKTVKCGWQLIPVQQAGNPTGNMVLYCSSNGAAYAEVARINTAGGLFVAPGGAFDSNAAGTVGFCNGNGTTCNFGNSAATTNLSGATNNIGLTGTTQNNMRGSIVNPTNAITQTTASLTLDAKQGATAVVTLQANVTGVTLSNFSGGQYYMLTYVQDATGSRTVTGYPGNVKWLPTAYRGTTHTAPTLTTTANLRDSFYFKYDGTNLVEISENLNN